MKKSGVFISIGRGTVVNEEALVTALNSGGIAGAALDVFKTEPLPQRYTHLYVILNDMINNNSRISLTLFRI